MVDMRSTPAPAARFEAARSTENRPVPRCLVIDAGRTTCSRSPESPPRVMCCLLRPPSPGGGRVPWLAARHPARTAAPVLARCAAQCVAYGLQSRQAGADPPTRRSRGVASFNCERPDLPNWGRHLSVYLCANGHVHSGLASGGEQRHRAQRRSWPRE